tara:strand:+ start:493 stop:1518 length:1026 start_codon:yes stop_codon:yes gene_type:complete
MKEIKNTKNKSILKKIFVKVCRLLGYEIIDQSNATIPTMGIAVNDNTNILGKKSISLPLGEVKITRRVKSLDIIIRTCMEVGMLTQNKKRIFEKHKSEYSLRSINSIIKSYINSEVLKNIEVNFTVVDHNSSEKNLNRLKKLFEKHSINCNLINLETKEFEKKIKKVNEKNENVTSNQLSNMANIYKSLILSKKCKDLIYFIEDDYIHDLSSLEKMVLTYERISSQINDELFICSSDYPYLYNNVNNTNILLGNNHHWRKIDESLCSFLTSNLMVNKHWRELTSMCEFEHYPFEKPLHNIYKNEFCISPIPSLSVHFTNINSIFGLSPNINWKKFWDDNEI